MGRKVIFVIWSKLWTLISICRVSIYNFISPVLRFYYNAVNTLWHTLLLCNKYNGLKSTVGTKHTYYFFGLRVFYLFWSELWTSINTYHFYNFICFVLRFYNRVTLVRYIISFLLCNRYKSFYFYFFIKSLYKIKRTTI